jgi:serine/threonine-protein kinase
MVSELDQPFGRVAVEMGFISREQFEECCSILDTVAKMGVQHSLQEILLRKGYVTRQEVLEIFRGMVKEGVRPRLGNFEILSKIGEGGMGAVYKARQLSLDRTVALKVLPPHLARDQGYLRRFIREAKTAGRLSHPHIITTLDVGESDGFHFIAMELVEGSTVRDMIRKYGKIPEAATIEIVAQIAAGLAYAARFNIIHRDIKPSNIIVAHDGKAKLCDLGLAKQLFGDDVSVTESGAAVGTPNYMSPEQAQGKSDTDARSDIYSLGATLYHMLTGRPPFEGETTFEILRQQIWDPVSPKAVNPELSKDVCALAHKMMARDRKERYQTAAELLTDLNAHKTALASGAAFGGFSRTGRNQPDPDTPRRGVTTIQQRRQTLIRQGAIVGGIITGVLLTILVVVWSVMPTETSARPPVRPPAPVPIAAASPPKPPNQADQDQIGEKAYLNAVEFESKNDTQYEQQIHYWEEVIKKAPRSRYAAIAMTRIAEKQDLLEKAAAAKKPPAKKK